jgi:hypothetical protein
VGTPHTPARGLQPSALLIGVDKRIEGLLLSFYFDCMNTLLLMKGIIQVCEAIPCKEKDGFITWF